MNEVIPSVRASANDKIIHSKLLVPHFFSWQCDEGQLLDQAIYPSSTQAKRLVVLNFGSFW
jgi:hypothetical protein